MKKLLCASILEVLVNCYQNCESAETKSPILDTLSVQSAQYPPNPFIPTQDDILVAFNAGLEAARSGLDLDAFATAEPTALESYFDDLSAAIRIQDQLRGYLEDRDKTCLAAFSSGFSRGQSRSMRFKDSQITRLTKERGQEPTEAHQENPQFSARRVFQIGIISGIIICMYPDSIRFFSSMLFDSKRRTSNNWKN
ncbi:MAG: hypothetical protein LBI20_03495 [Holosporales bacterium]|nr:hypothetical protein [Holosporales bacterium]